MLRTLHTVIKRWQRDEAALLAAAVSYYIALSLFPVLLILTSGLGAFFRWTHSGNNARDYLLKVISDQAAPSLAMAIEQSLGHIEDYSSLSGPIGMAILLFAALAIFAQFERAFDRMWNVRAADNSTAMASVRQMLTYRFRAFVMLCGVGLLIIVVFLVGVLVAAMKRRLDLAGIAWIWWGVELALQIGINAIAFAALYRFLPKVHVRWKDAIRGGLLAAIVWEIGRQVIATLVIGQHYSSAYGVIGCFLAVMLWGYYGVAVIFFGAEFVQVLGETKTVDNLDANSSAAAIHRYADSDLPQAATKRQTARPIKDTNTSGAAPSGFAIRHVIATLGRSKLVGGLFDTALAALVIYVALFLGLRHFRSHDVMQPAEAAAQRVVRFSDNPRLHRIALRIFAPLISTLPGPYSYAHADE